MTFKENTLVELCEIVSSKRVFAASYQSKGVPFFRGPLNDVLGRFVLAAEVHQPQFIVRLTADCPLTDPKVIDAVIEKANSTNIPKNKRFIHTFVDRSFNPRGPVAAVNTTPKVTYIKIIDTP